MLDLNTKEVDKVVVYLKDGSFYEVQEGAIIQTDIKEKGSNLSFSFVGIEREDMSLILASILQVATSLLGPPYALQVIAGLLDELIQIAPQNIKH